MYILTRNTKTGDSPRRATVARRVGVFRTFKGANKVKQRMIANDTIEAFYKIEKEHYFTTRAFWESIANTYWKHQEKKYQRMLRKFDRIRYKLSKMEKARHE